MSENEHLVKKEEENQSLLKTNSALISQLSIAQGAQERMENQLLRVYEEANEVRSVIDAELLKYE